MGCLFGYVGEPLPGLLDRMAALLEHRCVNGWEQTRLAIRENLVTEVGRGRRLGPTSPQVVTDKARRLLFAHNGVIFNRYDLTATYGEAEAGEATGLLRFLAENPRRHSIRLEGAFAGALASGDDFWLIRDPTGIKVVYWTRHGKRLLFASEVKALFADPMVERRFRTAALAEYLTFSFVPGERTMFEDIFELQPGTVLTLHNGAVATERYFKFENHEPLPLSEREKDDESVYIRNVRRDLEYSVAECCLLHSEPPAVFLSGGIDSSAVAALTAKLFPDAPIPTFSVHFGKKYANENEYVAMMVEKFRTDHTWLEIRPARFIKRMRDIIWKLDDPIGDPITVPNYLMAEAAARVSPVVLNGEGGDPCFGGPKNIPMMLSTIYGPPVRESNGGWLELDYLRSYRKCFNDLDQMLTPEAWAATGGVDMRGALAAILTPFFSAGRPRHFLNRLMGINIRLKGANLILVKVDKMTSANGLLALAPLFSKRIVQTSMACPPALKLIGNVEKGVLKKAVADIVPQPIIDRPKSGMMVPVRFWLQKDMRGFAKKVLSKRRIREVGLFNYDYVKKLLAYDREEVSDNRHGLKLWMLITFMLWHEQMVEGRR